MRVADTLVLHGFCAVDLVDGSVAAGSPSRRADGAFEVRVDVAPRGLRVRLRGSRVVLSVEAPSTAFLPHGPGAPQVIDLSAPAGTLVLVPRDADAPVDCGDELTVEGEADLGMRTPPVRPDLHVEGTLQDASGRWLPRRFSLDLARGSVTALSVWRTPAAATPASGGSLVARLWFGDDGGALVAPAAYALAELDVEIAPGTTRTFRAMADVHGDLVLAPGRVPPVPPGLPGSAAKLRVRAAPHADPLHPVPVDPGAPGPRSLGDPAGRLPGGAVRWLPDLGFTLVPGRRARLATDGAPALLVQEP